ncbi:MAG: ATP phosphoribosyltransferase regulatory subunit, partial [Clostridia bacterium]|nr:ATP phosphoribosyltransferase regulatory subunit [Clostridia bacterium]
MFIKETVKGMRDILPAEMEIREYLLGKLKYMYTSFGFTQIETPCMERIENLSNKQGGENEKLIFKVLKRGEKLSESLEAATPDDLCDSGMRYDLTVPLSRYYANNVGSLPAPFKSLQVGSVWRADRPQKGRFRQFTQCDIDILGDASNNAESELIYVTSLFLDSVGVKGNTVMV